MWILLYWPLLGWPLYRPLIVTRLVATSGTGRLFINGKQEAEGKLEHTVPLRFTAYEGMDIGQTMVFR